MSKVRLSTSPESHGSPWPALLGPSFVKGERCVLSPVGEAQGRQAGEKLGQASQKRRRGNALPGDVLKPSHGEHFVFDGPADVSFQEPKLRKLGQALFIPARDYSILSRPTQPPADYSTEMQKQESVRGSSHAGQQRAGRLPLCQQELTNRSPTGPSWSASLRSPGTGAVPPPRTQVPGESGAVLKGRAEVEEISTVQQKHEAQQEDFRLLRRCSSISNPFWIQICTLVGTGGLVVLQAVAPQPT